MHLSYRLKILIKGAILRKRKQKITVPSPGGTGVVGDRWFT